MSQRDSLLSFSLRLGTWWQTQVRVSPFFLLVMLLVGYHHKNLWLGAAVMAVLFVSVLVHEFGHVVAARMTGGSASDVLVWPFGGLAFVQPTDTLKSQVLTPAAGPITNAILCAVTFAPAWSSAQAAAIFHPLQVPPVELRTAIGSDMLVLLFWCNWVMLLLNLIPVFPFDGGRIVHALLSARAGRETATEVYLRIGMVAGVLIALAGLFVPSAELVLIGALVMILNLHEAFQLRVSDSYDDSFMGYDFSQGYTSLERSNDPSSERRPGAVQRWRERRRAEKQRKQQERELEVDVQLDAILEKVHQSGLQSLSDAERRLLDRASARYRDKTSDQA
jgi:Zn-dependent protease